MRDGWTIKRLDEVCAKFGAGPFGSNMKVSTFVDTGIPVVSGNHMTELELLEKSFNYITEEHANKMQSSIVQRNDVVITKAGTIGQVSLIPENSRFLKYVLSSRQLFVRPNLEQVLPKYLAIYLKYGRGQDQILSNVNRTGVPSLSQAVSFIKNVRIELPPLPEQKRIVDLISSVDSYIESLQPQLESAKRSRNAVLHELLTAGGDDWVETTLGEASEVIMGRQLSPSKKLGTRPRPYIRAANIGSWGINLEDIYEMDFTEIEERRFACQVGDTILVEGGNEKSVGCPALITEKESGLCIQNTVIRCRSSNLKILDPSFQYHLLRFMFWRGDFAQLCAGTTIMHLGQKRAEVVPISIPPIREQLDIVDTISKFDLVVTNLEKTLDNAKALRSGLLSDLLSGEHEIPASYDKVIGAA
jgi:restriction endonuclease S subunit